MRHLTLRETAAGAPPHRGWTVRHATVVQVVALTPPLAVGIALQGAELVGAAVVAIVIALAWEAVFAQLRRRALTIHGLTTGIIVAVMAPADALAWQIALAVSFGAVIGELVFGGRGFGFLNAGLAALAFLVFSFPSLGLAPGAPATALAVLPGALLLLAFGLISWRVLAATAAGLAAVLLIGPVPPDPLGLLAVTAFPLVFLIADPLGAAATNPGRVLYGLLAGALAGLFMGSDPVASGSEAMVFAALVAAVFAPLLDEVALRGVSLVREARRG